VVTHLGRKYRWLPHDEESDTPEGWYFHSLGDWQGPWVDEPHAVAVATLDPR
jgi:hypothetical protein